MNGWAIYLCVYYAIAIPLALYGALTEMEVKMGLFGFLFTCFNGFAFYMAVH